MTMVVLELDTEKATQALETMVDNMEQIGNRILVETMSYLEEQAVRFCPVDTGTLRSRIHTVYEGPLKARLEDGANYGVFVEFGTAPHEILPFAKKALHWKKDGKSIFARRVFHPGTAPQPFFRPAKEMTLNEIPRIFERHLGGRR